MGLWTGTIPTLSAGTAPTGTQLGYVTGALAATIGTWTSYTSTWRSSGTQPALGNGSLVAYYNRADDLVWVHILLTVGSTSTFGTGYYFFDLPSGWTLTHTRTSGCGWVYDSSTQAHYLLVAQRSSDTTIHGRLNNITTSSGIPTSASPVTLATGDQIQLYWHGELS